jgi:GNAT superfamily N-acetyltransferase
MDIIQIDTANLRDVRRFLDFPFQLYRDVPQWVPPFAADAKRMLDRKKHPFYQHSTAEFFIAVKADRVVGRLAVLDHRRYNDWNHAQTAFLYLFESEDDRAVSRGLFNAAIDWARARGLTLAYGPKGFSALDSMGLLVKGFEHRPALGIAFNPAYYAALWEDAGFESDGDVVSGYLGPDFVMPEKVMKVAELVQQRRGLRIATYKTRGDLKQLVEPMKTLYNSALSGTTDNFPITDEEANLIAKQLINFADPRLIKIVMKVADSPQGNDEIVGFMFGYPDPSAAIQRCKGKLFPFGWLDILIELRRTKWINLNGAGLLEKYRGSGGTALLFTEMYKSVRESDHYLHADVVQIGAENDKMQREIAGLGINFYKAHRMYRRSIA